VIELANFIAGPLCGTLLADMGADVVKVESPKGDMSRATPPIRNGESVSFVALNRNKRSLVLDLKRPEATEILLKLAAQSDVFVEANRPGALDKLGLAAAQVKAVNPRIIYTSVSGFGQSGPIAAVLASPYHRGVLRRVVCDGRTGKNADAPGRADGRRLGALLRPTRRWPDWSAAAAPAKATSPTCRWSKPRLRRRPGKQPTISNPECTAAARQPASPQRALSIVRNQGPALSRDRHAERSTVR